MVHLYEVIPKLSSSSASTVMMQIPCFMIEDIVFHPFPQTCCLETGELKGMTKLEAGKEDAPGDDLSIFSKRFFSKHGWDFVMMSRTSAQNENPRASSLFNQREQKSQFEISESPEKADIAGHGGILEESKQEASRQFSPPKQTILKKAESVYEEKILGNVVVTAYNYKKEFKVQYSLINHTYSTNLESFYSASIDQVAKIIESSDNIYNNATLKELLKRKGLNHRFLWPILAKLRVHHFRDFVMIDILIRVMRRIINEEIKLKSRTHHSDGAKGGYFLGNQQELFQDIFIQYANAILLKKFSKQKQVFDETLLGLFLSRMSVFGILFSLNLRKEELIYLESKEIIEDIIEAPNRNPILFINAIQNYFNIEFKPEFLHQSRSDKYLLLSNNQPITANNIQRFKLSPH